MKDSNGISQRCFLSMMWMCSDREFARMALGKAIQVRRDDVSPFDNIEFKNIIC